MSDPTVDDRVKLCVERIHAADPDLTIRSVIPLVGRGQNNAILIVNGNMVFRFPLYDSGVERLGRLVRIVQIVAQSVSVSVPKPIYVALENPKPGHAFIGYPLIQGEPLGHEVFGALPDEETRQSLTDQLAVFLKQLHAIPPESVLPDEVTNYDPLAEWDDLYRRIQHTLFGEMRSGARRAVAHHFETFLSDPQNRSIRPSLIHGDFGPSNILFDPRSNRLSGVIDFDSAQVGDPAIDLAAASCYGLDRFARVDPEALMAISRIQFYVGTFALQEALFGAENGDNDAFARGIAAYR